VAGRPNCRAGPARDRGAMSLDAQAQCDAAHADARPPPTGVLEEVSSALASARAQLARPFTLALIAGAAGLLGFWIARQPRPSVTPSTSDVAAAAATNPVIGLAVAFMARYAVQTLTPALLRFWVERHKRVDDNDEWRH
jgi:hypothetical protein